MSEESAHKTFTRPQFSAAECAELLARVWGVVVAGPEALQPLPSYDDQNFAVTGLGGTRHVLKLFHAEEKEATMELQDAVMRRLREAGVAAPFAVPTRAGASWARERGHLARLLEWVPGEDWCKMDLPGKLAAMQQVGEVSTRRSSFWCAHVPGQLNGRMDAALRDVRTAGGAERRRWVWRTSDVLLLCHYRPSVAGRLRPAAGGV